MAELSLNTLKRPAIVGVIVFLLTLILATRELFNAFIIGGVAFASDWVLAQLFKM